MVRDRLPGLAAEIAGVEARIAEAEGQEAFTGDVKALLLGLSDLAREVFTEADPDDLRAFSQAVGLSVSFDPDARQATATATVGVACVSEGDLDATPTPPILECRGLSHPSFLSSWWPCRWRTGSWRRWSLGSTLGPACE